MTTPRAIPRTALLLAACAASLAAACATGSGSQGAAWRSLFDGRSMQGLRSTEYGGEGQIVVAGGALVLQPGSPLTGFTVDEPLPDAPYELEVEAARLDGTDFFCGLTFPVPGHPIDDPALGGCLTLILGGWGGAVCGLSSLDGEDASENATRTVRAFESGRYYRVRLAVDRERVVVTIDGEPFLDQSLRNTTLSLRPEVELSAPLGLCCFSTRAGVRTLRWRPRD